MDNLPTVESCKICFIRPFALTDFTEKYQHLNQQFSFLANSNAYSNYYRSLEVRENESRKYLKPIEIDGLGPLEPLKKKHTLASYWRSFRIPLENDENKTNNELFLLLPLILKIPIKSIRAQNKSFPIKMYAYLFSFGSCCINMEVNISKLNYSLDELPSLISDIRRSNLGNGEKDFGSFSYKLVKKINKELFANENGINEQNSKVHTFILLNTDIDLQLTYPYHKRAIAAIMNYRKNIQNLSLENINEAIGCVLKVLNTGEILLFIPNCTFIYPSFDCNNMENTNQKRNKRTLHCMCNNYCSLLNVIFSTNRFLKDSLSVNENLFNNLPEERAQEIIVSFTKAFPKAPLGEFNNIYFYKIFHDIASRITLYECLEQIWADFNEFY